MSLKGKPYQLFFAQDCAVYTAIRSIQGLDAFLRAVIVSLEDLHGGHINVKLFVVAYDEVCLSWPKIYCRNEAVELCQLLFSAQVPIDQFLRRLEELGSIDVEVIRTANRLR